MVRGQKKPSSKKTTRYNDDPNGENPVIYEEENENPNVDRNQSK